MKVVLQYRASEGFRRQIAAMAPFDVAVIDETDDAGFDAAMADAEVLWHVLKPVTAAVIAAAPRLRLIQKLGVGVNTIDLEAARAAGVAVANMPGTNSAAVAEMALGLMLAALRRLLDFDQLTRRGEGWRPDAAILDSVGEIGGRVVGLVGFGDSARRLAPVLAALGARVVYTARTPKPDAPYEYLELEALLAAADIVSLHAPLTPDTAHLIDAAALARMKAGAILINTARGGLVNEAALVAALQSGHLRAAGLDVFDPEPPAPDNPLFALAQVVLSPHLAWLTPETLARSLTVAVENVTRLQAGEPLLHRVV